MSDDGKNIKEKLIMTKNSKTFKIQEMLKDLIKNSLEEAETFCFVRLLKQSYIRKKKQPQKLFKKGFKIEAVLKFEASQLNR